MSVTLTNTTSGDIFVTDLGTTFRASVSQSLTAQQLNLISSSSDIVSFVSLGKLVFSTTRTLSPAMAAKLLNGGLGEAINFDNSTNGFVASNVQAAIEEARATVPYYYVSGTSSLSTASAADVAIAGMSVTPPAGNYLCTFSCAASTDGVNAAGTFSLYNGTTRVLDSVRSIQASTTILGAVTVSVCTVQGTVSCQSVITADGTNAISAYYNRSQAGGSVYVGARSLVAIRIL